jgi:hypothetical protein
MRALLLALILGASLTAQARDGSPPETYAPPPRILANEIHAFAGVLTGGYTFHGGSYTDAFFANGTSTHYLFKSFTADASLFSLLPLRGGGPRPSITLTARVGYTSERWSLVAGPVIQATYPSTPIVQLLPSLRALYQAGPVMLNAGLLDLHGMVPAHVGASYGPVGLAYVLPLGARAHARIPLSPRVSIHLEGFFFRVGVAQSALFTVGLVGAPPSSRPGDDS